MTKCGAGNDVNCLSVIRKHQKLTYPIIDIANPVWTSIVRYRCKIHHHNWTAFDVAELHINEHFSQIYDLNHNILHLFKLDSKIYTHRAIMQIWNCWTSVRKPHIAWKNLKNQWIDNILTLWTTDSLNLRLLTSNFTDSRSLIANDVQILFPSPATLRKIIFRLSFETINLSKLQLFRCLLSNDSSNFNFDGTFKFQQNICFKQCKIKSSLFTVTDGYGFVVSCRLLTCSGESHYNITPVLSNLISMKLYLSPFDSGRIFVLCTDSCVRDKNLFKKIRKMILWNHSGTDYFNDYFQTMDHKFYSLKKLFKQAKIASDILHLLMKLRSEKIWIPKDKQSSCARRDLSFLMMRTNNLRIWVVKTFVYEWINTQMSQLLLIEKDLSQFLFLIVKLNYSPASDHEIVLLELANLHLKDEIINFVRNIFTNCDSFSWPFIFAKWITPHRWGFVNHLWFDQKISLNWMSQRIDYPKFCVPHSVINMIHTFVTSDVLAVSDIKNPILSLTHLEFLLRSHMKFCDCIVCYDSFGEI